MTSITNEPKDKDDLRPGDFASGAGAAGDLDRLVAHRSEDAAPTVELKPDGRMPSAQPQWRREMEAALSEHRRAAASVERRLLDPVEVPSTPASIDRSGTIGAPSPRRRNTRGLLYLAFGTGGATLLALVGLIASGALTSKPTTSGGDVATAVAESTEIPRPAAAPSSDKRVEQEQSAAAAITTTTAAVSAAPTMSAAAPIAASTAAVTPLPISSAVAVASPNPSSTLAALPPCTATLRVGCRFVPQPSKNSMAATAPNSFGTTTKPANKSTRKRYDPIGF